MATPTCVLLTQEGNESIVINLTDIMLKYDITLYGCFCIPIKLRFEHIAKIFNCDGPSIVSVVKKNTGSIYIRSRLQMASSMDALGAKT